MITKQNQTNVFKNEVIRDAIRLIRQGESAFAYHPVDVASISKIMGSENITVFHLDPIEALEKFDYNGTLFIISYNEQILETMALAMEKIYILSDMGFKLSKPDKTYIKNSLSRPEVERRFWELYDKYSNEGR